MGAVYRAADEANAVAELLTDERISVGVENWTHLDPLDDLILAFVGERLVAASEISWADTGEGDREYRTFCRVHPEWRHRGIGGAMLARNERRLTELAKGHDVSGKRVLMSWLQASDADGLALFAERGYERVRDYYDMTRPHLDDILLPDLPPGLEVRPVSEAELPQVWDALIEAFRDHFGGQDGSAASFRRWSQNPNFDRDLLVVAFDGDEVAAGVLGFVDPAENEARGYRRGWTDPIFTRRRWRRRGLASALIGRALLRLRERGMSSAHLDVDSENPNDALGLYTRHGFVIDGSTSEWHKPLDA